MPFLQFKIPVDVQPINGSFGKGWVISKHKPHVTFVEFYVEADFVEPVVQWMTERKERIAQIVANLEFKQWHVLRCKDKHFAVLVNSSEPVIDGHPPAAPLEALSQRQILLQELIEAFGCISTVEPVLLEGLPVWQYRSANSLRFSFNRYNRPEVWYPHVTIAVKFNHLEDEYDLNAWTASSARTSKGELIHSVINKAVLL